MNDKNNEKKKKYQREYHAKRQKDNPEYVREQVRKSRKKARTRALRILGDVCNHCGFTDVRALQIDHREGGGSAKRKHGGTAAINFDVPKHPELYQLLCANCNWIKRVENKENVPPME